MTTKDRLHELVNCLPDSVLVEAELRLELLLRGEDPVLRAFLEAPVDNEPLTPEEIVAIEEADAEIARGEGIPWEVVRARLLDKD